MVPDSGRGVSVLIRIGRRTSAPSLGPTWASVFPVVQITRKKKKVWVRLEARDVCHYYLILFGSQSTDYKEASKAWLALQAVRRSATIAEQILQISFFSMDPFLGWLYDNRKITPGQKANQKRNVSALTND